MAEGVSCRVVVSEYVNIAFHQNAVPFLQEIEIANQTGVALSDVEIVVTTEPPFTRPLRMAIAAIAAGGVHHLASPAVVLDAGLLRRLTEGLVAEVKVEVVAAGLSVAAETAPVRLVPASHWGGSGAAPELLAAFVRPNDPVIDAILHDASRRLVAAGRQSAMDGYSTHRRERVWEVASAIWSAVAAFGLTYVLPPASFERSGQKVRWPGDVVERKTGTCLDFSLLLAAAFEQAGLHPILVVVREHAFVGLWLTPESFAAPVVDDMQMLRKRRDLDEMIFVESTLLATTPPGRFLDAVAAGRRHIDEKTAEPLEFAVDIARARMVPVRPVDLGDATAAAPSAPSAPAVVDMGLDEAPSFADDVVVREVDGDETADRLEKWKRKLLDLTLRNKLLNFKEGKKSVLLAASDPAKLEDLLAQGERLRLMARMDAALGGQVDPDKAREQEAVDRQRRAEALDRREVDTPLTDKELDDRLTDLYRMARTAFEEGGANVLFLALGFLKWTQKDGSPPLKAPLLLIPVALHRSSARAGFRLALHEEEPRFNPTLLQLLRQDHQLTIPDLDKELPTDGSGLDVRRVWRIVREYVRDRRGWEVTEEVVLSTFSFTKFLMWRDLVERMAVLKKNPVVAHLIDTPKLGYGSGNAFPDPAEIDRRWHPRDLFTPLSADSSQIAAVAAAAEGRDFVLFGPPGTGKSQTIANMICQCLAMGKTVLFVSQKTAALEVVQKRLRDIGLGSYCLEVHSAKAQKSEVLGNLKAAWHERARETAAGWEETAVELARERDRLNALVEVLHRRHANGLTPYEAFGLVVAGRDKPTDFVLDWRGPEPDRAKLTQLRELCRDMALVASTIGSPSNHPLRGLERDAWSPMWQSGLAAALQQGRAAVDRFESGIGVLCAELNLAAQTFDGMLTVIDLAELLIAPSAAYGADLLGTDLQSWRAAVARLESLRAERDALSKSLSVAFRPTVFGENLKELRQDWREATESNFLVRSGRKQKVRQRLQAFAEGNLPDDIEADLVRLIELDGQRTVLAEAAKALGPLASFATGPATALHGAVSAIDWAREAQAMARRLSGEFDWDLGATIDWLKSLVGNSGDWLGPGGAFRAAAEEARAAWLGLRPALVEVERLAKGSETGRPAETGDGWIVATRETWRRWSEGLGQGLGVANAWCQWVAVAGRVRAAGLGGLVDAVSGGQVAPAAVGSAFELAYARWWAERVVHAEPVLSGFMVKLHEASIETFRKLDAKIAELAKKTVRARLAGTVPSPSSFGQDVQYGTLARELTKKTRHMPLRKLFEAIPDVLPRLTPCLMMSPLSIAQYLPAGATVFDIVIFDEASQVPVWDAVGAMARGRQVVIAGDPEQLPPTSVGERGVDEIEDAADVEDQESILSECIASNIPHRRLDWHYRSRHESLIAFSNRHYYDGRLVTFPAPVTEDKAVSYVHVPNGVYERGSGRVNREEARVVVADVVRRLKDPGFAANRRSLGVVTFNGEQCRLIENLLDEARRKDPELEAYFDEKRWHEPVFVKNLENVQGDERDTILFSVAVAPDEAKRPVSTISSLNKEGGYRRLNVAITRARQEMVVFATLKPDQINLASTRARAIRDFKHFLEFADRGTRAIAEAFAPTGRDTESVFEDAVKAALERRGWAVHPQIGVSGFRVDLGVVHHDFPGVYLAGVECDGATYHRAATARDRDRLRESVLTGLGWRIRRVWSTDWWMDAAGALDRLDSRLREDLEADRAARRLAEEALALAAEKAAETARASEQVGVAADGVREIEVAAPRSRAEISGPSKGVHPAEPELGEDGHRETVVPERAAVYARPILATVASATSTLSPSGQADAAASQSMDTPASLGYVIADLVAAGFAPDQDAFYDAEYRPRLAAMIAHVVAIEGPIYEDVLMQRVARAHGFARTAGRIREVLTAAIPPDVQRTADDGRDLLWAPGADTATPIPYRTSSPDQRDNSDIPLVELASLARASRAASIDDEACLREMATKLGLGKLRATTRARLMSAMDLNQRSS